MKISSTCLSHFYFQSTFYLYLFIYFTLTSAVYVCPFLNPFTYSLLFIRLICYFLVSTTSLACLSLILTLIIATSTATHIKSLYYHMPLCTCFFSRAFFFVAHTEFETLFMLVAFKKAFHLHYNYCDTCLNAVG